MKIINIKWATDGEEVAELETEMTIPEMPEEEIADYLSDKTGWLVESFEIEKLDMESLAKMFSDKGMKIEWEQDIPENHQNVFWYGGDVATITYEKAGRRAIITVKANGDVEGNLFKNGEEIDSFKDRCNRGDRHDVDRYIANDAELEAAIFADSNELEGDVYKLSLDDNNWIEIFFDGSICDGSEDVKTDLMEPVVADNDNIFDELEDVNKFLIWCREIIYFC